MTKPELEQTMNDSDAVDEILTTLAERVAVEAQQLKIDAIDYPLYIGRRDGIVKAIKTELDQHYTAIREKAVIEARIDERKSMHNYMLDLEENFATPADGLQAMKLKNVYFMDMYTDQLKASKREE